MRCSTLCGSPQWTGSPRTPWPSPSTCRTNCVTSSGSPRASICRSAATSAARRCAAITRSARRRPAGRCGSVSSASPDGVFSSYAGDRLRAGDVLDVMTPTGRFFTPLDPANAKHYVAIAAGSGITPVMSILASTLEVEPRSQATLIYVNRMTTSIMFLEELEDLKNRFPDRFWVLNFLSRKSQESDVLSGRINRAKLARLFTTVLPPTTSTSGSSVGHSRWSGGSGRPGLLRCRRGRIHTELFHVGALPPPPLAQPRRLSPAAAPSPSSSTAVRPRSSSSVTVSRSSTISSGPARTHPTRARTRSAAPAGPSSSKALSAWSGPTRSSPTRSAAVTY